MLVDLADLADLVALGEAARMAHPDERLEEAAVYLLSLVMERSQGLPEITQSLGTEQMLERVSKLLHDHKERRLRYSKTARLADIVDLVVELIESDRARSEAEGRPCAGERKPKKQAEAAQPAATGQAEPESSTATSTATWFNNEPAMIIKVREWASHRNMGLTEAEARHILFGLTRNGAKVGSIRERVHERIGSISGVEVSQSTVKKTAEARDGGPRKIEKTASVEVGGIRTPDQFEAAFDDGLPGRGSLLGFMMHCLTFDNGTILAALVAVPAQAG